MSSSEDNKRIFFERLRYGLLGGGACKATLSKSAAAIRWKRVLFSAFQDAHGERLIAFHYDDGRQVERKNYSPEEAYERLKLLVPSDFHVVNMRLPEEELIFECSTQGTYRLKRKQTSEPLATLSSHNRTKHYLIPPTAPFLARLGITGSTGAVRREMHDKFRQINKFIEIIAGLLPDSALAHPAGITAIDFGSGKHYLTFALYEYLSSRSPNITITGVEQRPELVSIGRDIATALEWRQLQFVTGSISDFAIPKVDLVVALHACDTATDDALAKAIVAEATFICVAPCCHKYVRKHFQSSEDLLPMLRHGILEERFAEGLTDSLRVLALEAMGYQAKLFEFISLEHTAKNVMITATRANKPNQQSLNALRELKNKFALKDFYLDTILKIG